MTNGQLITGASVHSSCWTKRADRKGDTSIRFDQSTSLTLGMPTFDTVPECRVAFSDFAQDRFYIGNKPWLSFR